MFKLTLDGSKRYAVKYKHHVIEFAGDETAPNPLAATYAALAGCAGVYAGKACKSLGIAATGIEIECKPVLRAGNFVVPSRFVTEIQFPDEFTAEQKARVIEEVKRCAVKELIHAGPGIEFDTHEKL
jgi:uncharacterized OsmC-like protein